MIVVADAEADTVARQVADATGGYYVPLDPAFGIYRVVMPDKETTFDIANALGNDIATDLARRDRLCRHRVARGHAAAADGEGRRVRPDAVD